jgi:tripartite-type tricarboxylate transporter receptor subunit TctC
LNRRVVVRALGCALVFLSPHLWAQSYPSRPIDLIIPLAAGDATDIAGRAIGEMLSRELKVPVVPQNKPGAGGGLGTDQLAKAPKDGYTIGLPNNAAVVFRALVDPAATNYDAFKDLTPLGLAMRSPTIIAAGADAPFKNFREMVEYSKKNPGKVRIGTAGGGSVGDFCIQTINFLTDAGLTAVPFKGATPGITAVRGGHIEAVALALGALRTHIDSGAMRGIVISSKWKDLPNVPTMQELGFKDPLFGIWTAFYAPAGIPDEVTRVLVPAIQRAVSTPEMSAQMNKFGISAEYLPPDKLLAEMKNEHERVVRIGKAAGLIK